MQFYQPRAYQPPRVPSTPAGRIDAVALMFDPFALCANLDALEALLSVADSLAADCDLEDGGDHEHDNRDLSTDWADSPDIPQEGAVWSQQMGRVAFGTGANHRSAP